MASVELKQVRKSFGSTQVVHGVDISIADGEFVVLVGPSGCGKSTLLRMIAGLEEISEGEIMIGDRVVNNVPPKQRDIAMVFQNYALYPHMKVFDNMAFSMKLAGRSTEEMRQRVDKAAQILGLADYLDRYPRQLSGGQRQRVAMTMADTIVVMNGGRVEQIGTPLDLYDEPANLFVAGFIGSPAMNFLPGRLVASPPGRGVQIAEGCVIPVPGSGGPRDREVILGVRPEHFNIGESCVNVQVIVVEPTGADTQVFCKLAGHNVSAISRERHTFRPGDTISLKPFEGKTYLFEPASGARIA